ncbi:MAG: type II toxin-antitoxin system HicB family antitoxin [Chloroflexi bacterium]|nr:type II toxin-antitoxin system HicB family antitoxin [Chloroflexota bacterium]MYE40026.1 type II toxin-antitoxin system HicB family antitoxin [Chloroflexota bacterium]
MKFKVVLYEHDEGVAVKCPTLPGCVTQGNTVEEALEEIQIAIREFLEAIWGEVNKDIAEDMAEYDDLRVSLDEVEVDIEGIEDTQPQAIEATI